MTRTVIAVSPTEWAVGTFLAFMFRLTCMVAIVVVAVALAVAVGVVMLVGWSVLTLWYRHHLPRPRHRLA